MQKMPAWDQTRRDMVTVNLKAYNTIIVLAFKTVKLAEFKTEELQVTEDSGEESQVTCDLHLNSGSEKAPYWANL